MTWPPDTEQFWPQESSNQSDRDQPLITTLDRRHPPGLLRDSRQPYSAPEEGRVEHVKRH